jgi:hypothetical protein
MSGLFCSAASVGWLWAQALDRKIGSSCEAAFAHSQGDDDTLLGPIEVDGATKLGGHTPVHQLTSEALQLDGRHDRRAAAFGPHNNYVVIIGIARDVQAASSNGERAVFCRVSGQFVDDQGQCRTGRFSHVHLGHRDANANARSFLVVRRKQNRDEVSKKGLNLGFAETNRRTGPLSPGLQPDRRSRPPIPCADHATRPDFPVRAGQFLADRGRGIVRTSRRLVSGILLTHKCARQTNAENGRFSPALKRSRKISASSSTR